MLNLSHKKLDIWKFSLDLLLNVYKQTKKFPKSETLGLTSQIRRASVSVTSNIAEGLSRISSLEKIRFLEISRSSLVEIDTQLEIAITLGYLEQTDLKEIDKISNSLFAMLTSLIKKIKTK